MHALRFLSVNRWERLPKRLPGFPGENGAEEVTGPLHVLAISFATASPAFHVQCIGRDEGRIAKLEALVTEFLVEVEDTIARLQLVAGGPAAGTLAQLEAGLWLLCWSDTARGSFPKVTIRRC